MIREVLMPQLGMGMSEGSVAVWEVKEGERVERGQPLLSIETEKVTTEIPSSYSGLLHIIVGIGIKVPVEVVIGQIAETDDEYQTLIGKAETTKTAAKATVPQVDDPIPTIPIEQGKARLRISGLARTLARASGVDPAAIPGTGPVGRIVKRDVVAYLAHSGTKADPVASVAQEKVSVQSVSHPSTGAIREKARIAITGMRRTIGERMTKAKNLAPHTHIFFEIDVTKLTAVRQMLQEREKDIGARISLTAIFTRALALACHYVPICNAAVIDNEIVIWDEVNVGIAVAIPGRGEYDSGLLLPVVRNVEAKGLLEIDRDIRLLVARARDGKLSGQDMAGATITISSSDRLNTGGWMVGTPLLSLPQVIAFSPGAPVRKPVVRSDGQIEAGDIMPCCLTFDHRAMDGEPASLFAKKLTDFLGNPELMLL